MIYGKLMILMKISITKTWNSDMPNKLLEILIFECLNIQSGFNHIENWQKIAENSKENSCCCYSKK